MKSENRKLLRNSIFNSFTFLLPTAFMLLMTPFFIKKIGNEGYGLWMVTISVLGLAGTLELGLGVATTKYVAEYATSRDERGLSTIFSATLFFFGIIGIIAGVLLFWAAPFIVSLLKISPGLIQSAILSLQIIAFAIWPSLAIGALLSVPRGLQRYGIPSLISIIQSVGAYIGAFVIVLFIGSTIPGIMVWIVALYWTLFLLSVLYAWWVLRPFGVKIGVERPYLRNFLSFSAYSALSNIGSKLFTSADRILVAGLLGVSFVTYYTLAIGLANKTYYLAGYLTQAIMPRVSELDALRSEGEITGLFQKSTRLISILSLGIGAALFAVSWQLLFLWLGESFALNTITAFRWLIVIYSLLGVLTVAYFVVNGIGFPQIAAIGALGGGIAMTILMVPFSKLFGLDGAALANIGYLLNFIPMFFLARKYRLPFVAMIKWFGLPILFFLLIAILTILLPVNLYIAILLLLVVGFLYGYLVWKEAAKYISSSGEIRNGLFQGILK